MSCIACGGSFGGPFGPACTCEVGPLSQPARPSLDISIPEVEALQRILVCCDNGADPLNKIAFIRRVAKEALGG